MSDFRREHDSDVVGKLGDLAATAGLRRIRRTFQELAAVQTASRSPSPTTQTGVATGVPSRRKVVRLR